MVIVNVSRSAVIFIEDDNRIGFGSYDRGIIDNKIIIGPATKETLENLISIIKRIECFAN